MSALLIIKGITEGLGLIAGALADFDRVKDALEKDDLTTILALIEQAQDQNKALFGKTDAALAALEAETR